MSRLFCGMAVTVVGLMTLSIVARVLELAM